MGKRLPVTRLAGPTVLVSLVLFAVCTLTAIFLYRQHATTAASVSDDIGSRKIAAEIETTLKNLVALLQNGNDQVDSLHERIEHLLVEAQHYANSPEEMRLEERLEQTFTRYQEIWEGRFAEEGGPETAVKTALRVLHGEALPRAQELRNINTRQLEQSERELRRTVSWMAWGLALVGTVGGIAGLVLGFGVARAVRQSIYRLSVRIQDAADKLRQDLPTVTFAPEEGIDYLHEQMKGLVREIEQVVGRLQQREREVLRAERLAAVGQLAAGVAHELRNPLTAVKMLVQTSREDLEARGMPAEDVQLIEHEIRRLEGSLQGFLDFARPPQTERRRLDLGNLVEEAAALLGGRARKQGVKLNVELPDFPLSIEADGEQLRQVFVNLGLNALDAMPQGGQLTVAFHQPEKDSIEVRVSDTGSGIAPGLLPRLFEPFVSGKETGLGLGLSVSRRIAEAHGGSLEVVQGASSGACFALRLPLAPAVASLDKESCEEHVQAPGY